MDVHAGVSTLFERIIDSSLSVDLLYLPIQRMSRTVFELRIRIKPRGVHRNASHYRLPHQMSIMWASLEGSVLNNGLPSELGRFTPGVSVQPRIRT